MLLCNLSTFVIIKVMDCSIIPVEIDVQDLCRICLQKMKENIDLFSECKESKEILNKIYVCFQVKLLRDKYLPYIICSNCVEELNSAYSFRLKCVSIDERFGLYCKEHIEKNTCKIENVLNDTPGSETTDPDLFHNEYSGCNVLDIMSKSSENQESKENIININMSNIFKCNICNKVLKTKSTLLKHYVSMHEKRKHIGNVSGFGAARRYHCTTCSYSTPHSQTLVSHMRTHNGERPYSCECGKSFTQSSSLAAHRKTHSTTTYFTCSLCGKQFKHAFTLKNHMRVHENASFSCSICFKLLKSKETLQAHMHRHYKICNYNCEDCGDTFVTSAELHNHRRKHSLEKKIECHLCGYKTHTKKNLIIHLKRHTGNRTFKCEMCHVGFYTRSNLQRHLRVHTGDKPYSCPNCGQKFTYSPSLNKHMKIIHGVDYKWADWKETIVKLTEKTDRNISRPSKEELNKVK